MHNTRASDASFVQLRSESEAKFEHRLRGDWRKLKLAAL